MTTLTILLLVLAVVMALVGIVGAVLPALPGPPLAFAGLLTVYFVLPGSVSTPLLVVMLVLTILAQVVDYLAPMWLTKLGGGSKAAVTGSTIGMIVGLFFMPWGLIWGPFFGALVGELSQSGRPGRSLRVALMSFLSFLLTTGFKLVLSIVMTFMTIGAPLAYWN